MRSLGLSQTLFVVSAVLLVALGLFARASLDGAGWRAQDERKERLALAGIAAQHIDRHLDALLSQLRSAADDLPFDGTAASVPREYLDTTRRSWSRYEVPVETLFLAGPDGAVLVSSAEDPSVASRLLGRRMAISPELANGEADVVLDQEEPGTGFVRATMPVRDGTGVLLAILGAQADLNKIDNPFLQGSLGRTGSVVVADRSGRYVEVGLGADRYRVIDRDALRRLAERSSAVVGSVQSSSSSSDEPRSRIDLVALAPLTQAPLLAVVRQAEDEVFSEVRDIERHLLLLCVFVAILVIFVVWIMVGGVLRPVGVLTQACQQIAAGGPNATVPTGAGGEIGRLASAFQTMHSKLRMAHDELAAWSRELEARVAERTSKLLELQRNLIAEQEQVRLLSARHVESQEDERKRIALEIHDSIIQPLVGASYRIQAIEACGSCGMANGRELRVATEIVAETIRDLRRILSDLRPISLDVGGLVAALELYLERFENEHFLACRLHTAGTPVPLSNAGQIGSYRIIQEALNNVQRHAEATAVLVYVRFGRRSLAVLVRDDGRGFDPPSVCTREGSYDCLGIQGMHERATLVGGKLKIKSRPGRGTVVILAVPLDETRGAPAALDALAENREMLGVATTI